MAGAAFVSFAELRHRSISRVLIMPHIVAKNAIILNFE
jgi:hypothetical protein